MKRSKKSCRTALLANFQKHCNWKHLAFNSVSTVFEKLGDKDAAINAARLAVKHAGSDGSFHVRLVQLLWQRGACVDMAEVVEVLQTTIAFNNKNLDATLRQSLRSAQHTSRLACTHFGVPVYVQQMIHHP